MISYASKIWICVGLFFIFTFSGSVWAQPNAPSSGFSSLPEAIQIAITQNPSISEVQAQVDISTERIVQAKSGFMPQIDAAAVRFRPMMRTAAAVAVGASVILFDLYSRDWPYR